MSTITDSFYQYQAKAEEYIHLAAAKGAQLLHENDYFKDYQINDLTHNVKEATYLLSSLILLASTVHILFFAASLKTVLLVTMGLAGRQLIGRSMENPPKIVEVKDEDPETGSSSSSTVKVDRLDDDSDDEYLTIDGLEVKEGEANQIPDPTGERSSSTSRSSSPKLNGKASSTDRLLSACFKNFVNQTGQPMLWTTFFN